MEIQPMRVSRFLLDATACSGRIQHMIVAERGWGISPQPTDEDYAIKTQTIMDDLAMREVRVISGALAWDVVQVGVEADGTLRIEATPRWDSGRALLLLARCGLGILLATIVAFIAFQLGHDAGLSDAVTGIQLPTL